MCKFGKGGYAKGPAMRCSVSSFLILLSMICGSSKADFKFAHRVTLWVPS